MILQTARLTLREFVPGDLEALFPLLQNEEVMRFSVHGPLKSKEEANKYLASIIDHFAAYGFGRLALIHKETGRLVGIAGFIAQKIDGKEMVELAYRLHPDYWGLGLAFEAASALAEYAFNHLNLDRLVSIIDINNEKSIDLSKRLRMHLQEEKNLGKFRVKIFALDNTKASKARVYDVKPEDFSPSLEVAAIYVNVSGKCLLLQIEPNKQEGGRFGVPAGKLEKSETPLEGARRELFEETGIKAEEGALIEIGRLFVRKPKLDYVYHLFSLECPEPPAVILSKEHQSCTWASLEEAANLPLMQGAQEALDYYFLQKSKEGKRGEKVFSFGPVRPSHRSLVRKWLLSPQASQWFYGEGLQNTFRHLELFFAENSSSHYWLAFEDERPFAFFITSEVEKPSDPLASWCSEEGRAITLDMLIGEEDYLGKGYSVRLIQEFLNAEFPDADQVLIDPEATNARAIHVYKKAGFVPLGEFVPSHSPNLHLMMRLDRKKTVLSP